MDDSFSVVMLVFCSIVVTFFVVSFGRFMLDDTSLRECVRYTKAERCAILAVPVDEKGRPL